MRGLTPAQDPPAVSPAAFDKDRASLNLEQRRGRRLLLIIFFGWAILEGGLTVFSLLGQNAQSIVTSLVRICLSIGLAYAVWIGQRWARQLMLALIILAAIPSFFSMVVALSVPMFLLCALFVTAGFTLAMSDSIGSFLAFQRNRHHPAQR